MARFEERATLDLDGAGVFPTLLRLFSIMRIHSLRAGAFALAIAVALPGYAFAADDAHALLRPAANLSLDGASQLLDRAVAQARADGVHPCIAIDDASGNLLAFKRMDGAAPGCVAAAMKKAESAAINGIDTVVFYDLARKQNPALGSIPGILPAVAGVVIRANGAVVGSLGVAGGSSDAEEQQFASGLAREFEATLAGH
ncbi:GlcG/HbpS family heme-binding protein [Burkholderia sp. Ac-20379]|uniref:GlcG/HbpS family heme-binding protein n=2 Tax=Burkholderia sp. Ac-20379 TaxID=2703900 RepID=UPI0030D751D4